MLLPNQRPLAARFEDSLGELDSALLDEFQDQVSLAGALGCQLDRLTYEPLYRQLRDQFTRQLLSQLPKDLAHDAS